MRGFRKRVLERVAEVPPGRVVTYKELARAVGFPQAWRAVANVLASNPRPVEIPCHRVVRSDGKIGGYRFGARHKRKLLAEEGIEIKNGRVDLAKFMFHF
jgi:methylated-DNA-[protein]-cysteine S-methyltransferase